MASKTLSENINQAISDFGSIKQAIIDKGVEVPSGTPTSQYGAKIGEIQSGGGSDEDFISVIERTATNPTLPSGLTKIGDYAFYKYTNLVKPTLPNSVTTIGQYAFYYCTNLALTSLPSGLTEIGTNAFYYCTNLALTSLPDSLTSIGNSAFISCTGLTEITFKGKPNSISAYAFSGCTNLTTIRVPWSEGEVAKSPWGASSASIIYNYTET